MADWFSRLIKNHPAGIMPAEGVLDTPAKIRDYTGRMKAATKERLEEDRRAQWASWERARWKRIDGTGNHANG